MLKNSKEIVILVERKAYNWGGAQKEFLDTSRVLFLYLGAKFIIAYIVIII